MWIFQILYFGRRRSPVFLCGVCGVQCDPFENFPSPFWTKMKQNKVCRKEWKRNTVKKKEARRKLPSSVSLSPYDVVTQLAVQPLFRLSTRCFHDQNKNASWLVETTFTIRSLRASRISIRYVFVSISYTDKFPEFCEIQLELSFNRSFHREKTDQTVLVSWCDPCLIFAIRSANFKGWQPIVGCQCFPSLLE